MRRRRRGSRNYYWVALFLACVGITAITLVATLLTKPSAAPASVSSPPNSSAVTTPPPGHQHLVEWRVFERFPTRPVAGTPEHAEIVREFARNARLERLTIDVDAQVVGAPVIPVIGGDHGTAKEMLLSRNTVERLATLHHFPDAESAAPIQPAAVLIPALTETIELVLYINQNEHRFQRAKIEDQIRSVIRKEDRIETQRVLGENRKDSAASRRIGLLSALTTACESQRHVLILEDTFRFYVARDEFERHLQLVQRELKDRWNVIVLGQGFTEWSTVQGARDQDIQLIRIVQGHLTEGFIVNRNYLPTLVNLLIEELYHHRAETDSEAAYTALQKQDMWVAFERPVGGTQTDTHDELSAALVEQHSAWTIRDMAVYVRATEEQASELAHLIRHLYLQRYKGHRLAVVVHHPEGHRFVNRHRRSYSATFFDGVKYMTSPEEIEALLRPYASVQWIDLVDWCATLSATAEPFERVLESSASSDEDPAAGPAPDTASNWSSHIQWMDAKQRKTALLGRNS